MRPLLSLAVLTIAATASAEAPRVLSAGTQPNDVRLKPLKDLDGYFPFSPPTSREKWDRRAEQVRTQMRTALGILPEPTRTPLNPVIHGRVERDDYTVERVFFEAMPGFYVTGSLYRPKGKTGKLPGVLCPHGHWPDGRFMQTSEAAAKKEIESGAEKFVAAARSPLQARCVHLARMGCVVFHYDMIGYADSQQISFEVAHRFGKERPELNDPNGWGFYTPQAEAHGQSIMGLQTWSSIRALDFISSLPDVDPARLAVTGASGGGTQTFILAGLDRRVATAFPAVMVSTAMQGGCTCENASLLRVDTGNIEFTGLLAPKPMTMSAADDWTKEMAAKGFPELKKLWTLLGAPDHVHLHERLEFGHNYNLPSRAAMYALFNEHLGLKLSPPALEERDFTPLTKEEMTVWTSEHPAPKASGPEFEKKLLTWWRNDAEKKLDASPKQTRELLASGVQAIFGRTLETEKAALNGDTFAKEDRGTHIEMKATIRNEARGEEIPALFLHPKNWDGTTALWLSEKGKAGLLENNTPSPAILRLLEKGISVVGLDLFQQGEFLGGDLTDPARNRKVKNPREAAAYTYGYNHSLFAQRVHDVLTALAAIRDDKDHPTERTLLVALDGTGPIAAAARALSGKAVTAAAIHTGDFRFDHVKSIYDAQFLPCGSRFGDVPGLLALGTPGRLWLSGSSNTPPDLVGAFYEDAGVANTLQYVQNGQPAAAIDWLLQQQ